MFVSNLSCTECSTRVAADRLRRTCLDCGRPLVVRYDLKRAGSSVSREEISARRGHMSSPGLWRWRELLPLAAHESPVTLGEGDTPLLDAPRIAAAVGLDRLLIKDEGQNPTGSFKARGMTVAVSMARSLGARALCAPSAGNAGGALAAYGARAGLPVVIAMPTDVPSANRLEAAACGARVELVEGTIADCGKWLAERSEDEGWFDVSTLKEPYRVEGKKTMGYELAESLGWRLPGAVLYPTGGGTGLVGMAKAFAELRALGWIPPETPDPRYYAVQAEDCAPIADAFAAGSDDLVPPTAPRTVASGLRVPTPIGDRWMLRTIRASGGAAVSVGDDDLIAATLELAGAEGLFAAPEGGALVAALRRLLGDETIRRDEAVVLFNTGTGLKYAEAFPGVA